MRNINLDINIGIDMDIDMDINIDIDSYYYEFLHLDSLPCFESPWSLKQKINKTILFPSLPGVDGVGFSHKSGVMGCDFCLWIYALFSNLQVRKQAIFSPYLR